MSPEFLKNHLSLQTYIYFAIGHTRAHEEAGQRSSTLGVIDTRPPFPRVWSNLYSAWNLAFVSAYSNSPMFFSKLLAPIVHLYQEEGNQGLYIWPRVVCLFIHIQCEIMSRTISRMGRQPVLLEMKVSGRVGFYSFSMIGGLIGSRDFLAQSIRQRRGDFKCGWRRLSRPRVRLWCTLTTEFAGTGSSLCGG